VQLASRACAQAKGGQILATNVVRELVYGKGALFADAGSAELKGFDEPVHLFEVSAGAAGIDEGEQRASNRLPLFAAIALIAAIVTAGAVVLVLALSDDGGGEDGEPQYTVIHTRSAAADVIPDEITGDCVTAPLTIKGRTEGPLSGDIKGMLSSRYDAAYSLADGCKSFASSGSTVTTVDDGSTLGSVDRGFSLSLLSFEAAERSDVVLAGITTSGTGVYEGVAGRSVCRASLLVAPGQLVTDKASLDCTVKLAPRGSLPPVILQPIANAETVTTQLAPSGRGDTFKILLLYFNTRDEPQSGLSVRLPVPSGAQISSSAGEGDAMAEGAREWELPGLGPGEVASFVITVRLLSAEEDSITLLPQIDMQGRKRAFKSDPIVIAVER
jgi:hypothetical protein